MKFRLAPKFPDFPGSEKTYPKFFRVDGKPLTEQQKAQQLTDQIREELGVILEASKKTQIPLFTRLQIRQLSSLLDSFFSRLFIESTHQISSGSITITESERKSMNGKSGVMNTYKDSIRVFAKANGLESPLGDRLQIRGPALYWSRLRAHITHPTRLVHYQITMCDIAILHAILKWYSEVNDWVLEVRLAGIESVKQSVNKMCGELIAELKGEL